VRQPARDTFVKTSSSSMSESSASLRDKETTDSTERLINLAHGSSCNVNAEMLDQEAMIQSCLHGGIDHDFSRLFPDRSHHASSKSNPQSGPLNPVGGPRQGCARLRVTRRCPVASRAAYGHTGKERRSGERGGRGGPYFRSGKGGATRCLRSRHE